MAIPATQEKMWELYFSEGDKGSHRIFRTLLKLEYPEFLGRGAMTIKSNIVYICNADSP